MVCSANRWNQEKSYSVFFVFEWFEVETVGIKKNLIEYFFVFERFAVQNIAIKKNLIQYVFAFKLNFLLQLNCMTAVNFLSQTVRVKWDCVGIVSMHVNFSI